MRRISFDRVRRALLSKKIGFLLTCSDEFLGYFKMYSFFFFEHNSIIYTSTYFETNCYRDMRCFVDETIFHVTADVCVTRPVHVCTPMHETKPRTVYVRARYRNLCTENVAVIQ